jgi:uncharacterized beta-barrel protein YwiB (DUF1934 family)
VDKRAVISISGWQSESPFESPEAVEIITPGRFSREGRDYLITYRESERTGMGETTTTLRVDDRRVVLTRVGDVTSHMIFEQGRRHLSYYETGEGPLTVSVNASRVRASLTDEGGRVEVDYAVDIDQALAGENRIKINVALTKGN